MPRSSQQFREERARRYTFSMTESWVFGGNDPALGRGLNHLPYTAFLDEATGERHLAVGIGACLLDLHQAAPALPTAVQSAVRQPYLNALMALAPAILAELRAALQHLLGTGNRDRKLLEAALLPVRGTTLLLPADTRNYTDFYASRDHARRVGELFRPEEPLLPNYDFIPIAYHGRASSLVPSGTAIRRPSGQRREPAGPVFGPTEKLDYELELGFFIGQGNALGEPIPVGEADAHLFGFSLLNDWSARDIQAWEYQPLGPFLGKNFATTVSPWITPMAALAPFRVAATTSQQAPLAYLNDPLNTRFDLELAVHLHPAGTGEPHELSRVNSCHLNWSAAQMVAHHTSNGCNLEPGDLLATGTISGPEQESAGCLLELTGNGAAALRSGQAFLADGDEVVFSAVAERAGDLPIRLGECRGVIQPAIPRKAE